MQVSKIALIDEKTGKKLEVELKPDTDYLEVLHLRDFMEEHNVQLDIIEVSHKQKGGK